MKGRVGTAPHNRAKVRLPESAQPEKPKSTFAALLFAYAITKQQGLQLHPQHQTTITFLNTPMSLS